MVLLNDPDQRIRLEVVHNVCDLASEDPTKIDTILLKEVGKRVSSKSKTERKDAVTGISQIFQTHYIKPKLDRINKDEDLDISSIVQICMNPDSEENKSFKNEDKLCWIPEQIFCALSYNDDSKFNGSKFKFI